MQFKISKAHGEIKNVNLRTENNGDERVLAVDVKMVTDCEAKEIAPLFSDTPDLLGTLFDEAGQVMNPIVEFSYRVPIENIEVQIDKLNPYKGGKIKKNMRLIPRNGKRFEVTMTIQLSDVMDVRALANRLHEEVSVNIIERQQSMKLTAVG